MDHEDFVGTRIEWLFTGRIVFLGQDQRNKALMEQSFGHSTCTASKTAGRIYRASRQATLTVTKMPNFTIADILDVLETIQNDIQDRGRQGRSVVSISRATRQLVPASIPPNLYFSAMQELFQWFYDNNMIVVCAAGSNALLPTAGAQRRTLVDTAPTLFSKHFGGIFPIVVGASNNFGVRMPFSQSLGGSLQMYAPGVDITCAEAFSTIVYKSVHGTSYCELQELVLEYTRRLIHHNSGAPCRRRYR